MTDVWLVWFSRGELRTLSGVFSTEEKAEEYIKGVPKDDQIWFYSIKHEVDYWSFRK